MTRLQADGALVLVGIIWGFGFVAQKDGLAHIGPFTFVAARFLISALFVCPLVFYEGGFRKINQAFKKPGRIQSLILLCLTFAGGVLAQQYGMVATSVINASFITGLYVVLVPFAAWLLFRQSLSSVILVASGLSILGVWLLSGAATMTAGMSFGSGDLFILGCACCFAIQVPVLGHLAAETKAPFTLSFLQYLVVSSIALGLALNFETIDLVSLYGAIKPILYAGIMAGGIAYTVQAIAQQHTPSADTAIILSTEALFGGIGGVWLLHEKLTFAGLLGCAAIMAAIGLVEATYLWRQRRRKKIKA